MTSPASSLLNPNAQILTVKYVSASMAEDRRQRMNKEMDIHVGNCQCDDCKIERSLLRHPDGCRCVSCRIRREAKAQGIPDKYLKPEKNTHMVGCQCKECWDRLEAEREKPQPQTVLVSFESGHYKKLTGKWKGDSIWTHWEKPNGKTVHINKDKVEYYEEL